MEACPLRRGGVSWRRGAGAHVPRAAVLASEGDAIIVIRTDLGLWADLTL